MVEAWVQRVEVHKGSNRLDLELVRCYSHFILFGQSKSQTQSRFGWPMRQILSHVGGAAKLHYRERMKNGSFFAVNLP